MFHQVFCYQIITFFEVFCVFSFCVEVYFCQVECECPLVLRERRASKKMLAYKNVEQILSQKNMVKKV